MMYLLKQNEFYMKIIITSISFIKQVIMSSKILIIILLFTLNSFSQKEYTVTAKSGLTIRNKPNIKGYKIGRLKFKEKITVIEKTDFSFATENIKGYWVKVKTQDLKEGYVFNGFLKAYTGNKITYTLHRKEGSIHEELRAKINAKEITIISFEDGGCFEIKEVQDYDNDGFEEVLLEHDACGGNCCGNSISIISYNGSKFVTTKQEGYDFGGVTLNYDKNNRREFSIKEENIGHGNTTLCENEKNTYIFEKFQLKLIKNEKQNKLKTITEIKSEDFLPDEFGRESRENETLFIEYDIDNNGIKDKITAKYWARWGILNDIKIILNGKELKTEKIGAPKRIGILKTKTNNVHDLVIECDEILKWNGNNYKK